MASLRTVLGAILISGAVMAGPAFALPFLGKKVATAPQPAAKPAASPAAAPTAAAPSTAKPAPAPAAGALDLKGFRSATFGMTPAQVKAAVTSDFGPTAMIQEGTNAAQGTQVMVVKVDHLDPGPGAAQIAYVFGATSKTLAIINVLWTTGAEPTAQERSAIAQAGQQLAAYFQSGPAPAKTLGGMLPVGDNGLVLYSAIDAKNAGVLISVDGVEYHGTNAGKPVASPPPKGPASLRIGYELNAGHPDIKTLKPGSF